ncbi:MAG: 4-alpha-glucanotransferase [Ruminococcus sp.]|nr:4-alpha-glucanotransferase [Ruminococcus sp.]
MARVAGILMPITSLPSPYGIGTIGKQAREFADFLSEAGQKIWQILPAGPTSYGDSPYQSFSTYAGNPYMIDLDMLVEEELISQEQLDVIDWGDNPNEVDYEKIYNNRFVVLKKAYDTYVEEYELDVFEEFKEDNAHWLDDYALYMAVKKSFDMKAWTEWPDEAIKMRKPAAIRRYKKKLADDIDFWKWIQFKFYEQWYDFREYVNDLGIRILGDMPIYVAMDSADTWANPDVFWLDETNTPVCVAGCPPDYFSETGQLWGNPLYDWDYLRATDYVWWFNRIAAAANLYDITRIDHFRAFNDYYAIPFGAENAIEGEWLDGPGMDFFNKMKEAIGDIPIVAEDLGDLSPGVKKLLKDSGYPGMKVLEFAFDGDEENDFLPHNFKNSNCVVYTGTHDNDTIMGWYEEGEADEINQAIDYCEISEDEEFNWGLIRTAYASKADYAVIQMQDILGLGTEARMNIPSTLGGNWVWRIDADALTDELAERLSWMSDTYGRLED